MNPTLALAHLQRRAALISLPGYLNTGDQVVTLMAVMLLEIHLQGLGFGVGGVPQGDFVQPPNPQPQTPSAPRARRSPHLRTVAPKAAGATTDGGAGEHDHGACVASSF